MESSDCFILVCFGGRPYIPYIRKDSESSCHDVSDWWNFADTSAHTITDITFFFDDDTTVSLSRSATSSVARLSRPGLEDRNVNLARRSVQDSLMEDLRRLDPDVYYGELLTTELPRLAECRAEG